MKEFILKLVNMLLDNHRKRYSSKIRNREKVKLRNKDFTLISVNCAAGRMYHNLGLRFDSPTINTAFSKQDFCKFCANLRYYLSKELIFIDSDEEYPIAMLGDIRIEFVHYTTKDEAESKWNERKERVHWDNIYIITSDVIGMTLQDYEILNHADCKRKVIFTARNKPEIEDSFYLKCMRHKKDAECYQSSENFFTGLKPWEQNFNYVGWLNDEDVM